MDLLGYKVTCTPNGLIMIEGEGGKAVNIDEFISFVSYFSKSKKDSPQLKVSRPADNICAYCFTFANRHRYLARHDNITPGEVDDDSGGDGNDETIRDITSCNDWY